MIPINCCLLIIQHPQINKNDMLKCTDRKAGDSKVGGDDKVRKNGRCPDYARFMCHVKRHLIENCCCENES